MAAATIDGDSTTEIRKLRKKLRQIENLEKTNRELSEEENIKVEKKTEIREELLELLAEQGELTQSSLYHEDPSSISSETWTSFMALESPCDTINTADDANVPSHGTEHRLQTGDDVSMARAGGGDSVEERVPGVSKRKVTDSGDHGDHHVQDSVAQSQQKSTPITSDIPETKKAKKGKENRQMDIFSAERRKWRLAQFTVDFLDGHNDFITSVVTDGRLIVSSSRDTTVKMWSVDQCEELRNLGGHTNTVTCVQLLTLDHSELLGQCMEGWTSDDQFVISGSLDCSLRLWSVNTGQTVTRIYTFDPVTCLQYVTEFQAIFTGSDGGKIALWDLVKEEMIHSVCAHQSSISALQFSDGFVYSASEDGMVKVHELREKVLCCVYASENVHTSGGSTLSLRQIRGMVVRDHRIFYGDDHENLKILDWKSGIISKLRNNMGEFGSTDAVCAEQDLLLTSGYDLDNGLGFINVRSFSQMGEYLATLSDEETGHIMCLACHQTQQGDTVIVSGGIELKIWQMKKLGQNNRSFEETQVIQTRFINHLSLTAIDSDLESDLDDSDAEEAGGRGPGLRKRISVGSLRQDNQSKGWLSWCSVL